MVTTPQCKHPIDLFVDFHRLTRMLPPPLLPIASALLYSVLFLDLRETIMKILIADKFSENHLDRLQQLGCDVTYKPAAKAEELVKLIAPFQVLVVRSKKVSADAIKAGDQLAVIVRAGAGVNTIDVKAASARGVYVTNCPGKNSVAVAELVFALILGLDRRLADNVARAEAKLGPVRARERPWAGPWRCGAAG